MIIVRINQMKTRILVRGDLREANDNIKRVIETCRKHVLLGGLDIYSDVVITPFGEYLYFNAQITKDKKHPTLDICFADDSEWLKPNEEPND